jgi:hypothetical protein
MTRRQKWQWIGTGVAFGLGWLLGDQIGCYSS